MPRSARATAGPCIAASVPTQSMLSVKRYRPVAGTVSVPSYAIANRLVAAAGADDSVATVPSRVG